MRKIATVSMIAAAAFAVAACSKTESTNTVEVNATDMNAMNVVEGTTNDTMTNADGAMNVAENATNAVEANVTNATKGRIPSQCQGSRKDDLIAERFALMLASPAMLNAPKSQKARPKQIRTGKGIKCLISLQQQRLNPSLWLRLLCWHSAHPKSGNMRLRMKRQRALRQAHRQALYRQQPSR